MYEVFFSTTKKTSIFCCIAFANSGFCFFMGEEVGVRFYVISNNASPEIITKEGYYLAIKETRALSIAHTKQCRIQIWVS